MTNYEAHKEEIEDFLLEHGHTKFGIRLDGELIEQCSGGLCPRCNFLNVRNCPNARKAWLNEERKSEEMLFAESLNEGDIAEFSSDGKHWYLRYFKEIRSFDGTYTAYGDGNLYTCDWGHIRKPRFVETNENE